MKRLYKSSQDRIICGVCGGLANYFNIDPTLMRIIWIVLALMLGSGIIAYLIAAIIIPAEPRA